MTHNPSAASAAASESASRGEQASTSAPSTAQGTLALSSSVQLSAGQVLAERYRIERALRRYGTANVFRASDSLLREHIAIKVLPASPPELLLQRLRWEARLGRRIKHPNVLRLHDIGSCSSPIHGGRRLHFLTMQLVHGVPLPRFIASGSLQRAKVLPLAIQIASALAACHAAGVVHGQLSAASVLVQGPPAKPTAVLIGFGQQPEPAALANGQRRHEPQLSSVLAELDLERLALLFENLAAPHADTRLAGAMLDIAARCCDRSRPDRCASAAEVVDELVSLS